MDFMFQTFKLANSIGFQYLIVNIIVVPVQILLKIHCFVSNEPIISRFPAK